MDRKIVIIPTYNEKENIEAITRKVFSLPGEFQILVIDDGSPDPTGRPASSRDSRRSSRSACTCSKGAGSRAWARPT